MSFDPPPDNYSPLVSADDAIAAFGKTGLYADKLVGKTPQEFLANFTSYQRSTDVSPSGQLQPNIDQQPVWIIRYENIPDSPSSAGTTDSFAASDGSVTPTYLHDIVAIVNADTGVVEEVSSDLPDQVAQGAPQAHPAKANGA